jgi:hypothetical protein
MTHQTIRRRAILPTFSALALALAAAPAASADLDFSHGCTGRGPIVLDPKSHLVRAVSGWFPANAIRIGGQEDPIPGVPYC